MEYITASCVIRDHLIFRNGQTEPIFRDPAREPASGAIDPAQDHPSGAIDSAGFLLAAYQHFGFQYPKFYKMDLLCKLGWLACELLLREGFTPGKYKPEEIAVVLSNAHASLDTDYKYMSTVKDIPSPAVFVYTLPNIMIGEICIRHTFKGENAFFVSPSFDPEFIWQYVSELLENDRAAACVCGWVDLLGADFSAALFMVEKTGSSIPFKPEKMTGIAQIQNA
jgi:hypothetical protein